MDKSFNKLIINHFPKLDYAAAEAMNTLWTNLSYSGSDIRTIAFSSCRPDEGKTFIVMNLARTVAGIGKRVLIVDADLRKSVIAGRYRINSLLGRVQGLAHYLSGQCRMEDIVYETNYPNLNMVLAGHEVLNSYALISSPMMPDMINRFRKEYDIVLIDTPPVGTIIDAAIISRSCDGVALVVKEKGVSRREFAEARAQVEKVGGRLLGAILNDVEFTSYGMKKYYSKYYYKYDSAQ